MTWGCEGPDPKDNTLVWMVIAVILTFIIIPFVINIFSKG